MSQLEILEHQDKCPARALAQKFMGALAVLALLVLTGLAAAARYQEIVIGERIRIELDARLGPARPARPLVGMDHDHR